jgi:hypothetical protein
LVLPVSTGSLCRKGDSRRAPCGREKGRPSCDPRCSRSRCAWIQHERCARDSTGWAVERSWYTAQHRYGRSKTGRRRNICRRTAHWIQGDASSGCLRGRCSWRDSTSR